MNDQMAFNRPLSINWNSYLAPGLGGIKQNKCIIHCWTLRWFILFYSIKLRSQVWKLVSVFKASPPQSSLHLSQLHFDENLGTHGCLLCLRDMKLLMERTGGHFVCACVNRGCWSATEALSGELFTFSTSIFRLFSGAEWRTLDATFHKHVI